MKNKTYLFIKTSFRQIFRNKKRLVLTFIGIVLGLFLYLTANIGIDSYFFNEYNMYKDFTSDMLMLNGNINNQQYRIGKFDSVKYLFHSAKSIHNLSRNNIIVSSNIYGTDANFTRLPISLDPDGYYIEKVKIIDGRDISNEDIENESRIVIIDKRMAELMFNNNAVGKVLKFQLDSEDTVFVNFKIVGVFESRFNSSINFKKNDLENIYQINFPVYIPTSAMNWLNADNSSNIPNNNWGDIIIRCENKNEANNLFKKIVNSTPPNSNIFIHSKDSINMQIKSNLDSTKMTLDSLIAALFIFSGLTIMNTMFFSIKERIQEIGIRKAIGASDADIIFKFIFENIIICIISALIAIVLSVICAEIFSILLKQFLNISIPTRYEMKTIISLFPLTIIQAIIFSIIPATYAAKMNVISALRFD